MPLLTLLIPLAAAVLLGCAFVLQQRAAAQAPLQDLLRPRLLLDLVRSPMWLCGIALMVCGQILSAIALGRASVTLIEPLLSVNLLVALAVAALVSRRRLPSRDLACGAVVIVGLAAFVLAGQPQVHDTTAGGLRQWLAIGVICGVAGLLVALSRRYELDVQAPMLAAAAGCLAGLQDGLTRRSMVTLNRSPETLVTAWQPYAVVAVAVIVIWLQQSSFKAGPLRRNLPEMTVGEPIAGIAFGIVAFGDRLNTAAWALAVEAIGLAAAVLAMFVLAGSEVLSHALEEHAPHGHHHHRPQDPRC